jgi:hypothetical protein
MLPTFKRACKVLERLEGGSAPAKTAVEAVNNHLVLYQGISAQAVPEPVRRLMAKLVQQVVTQTTQGAQDGRA